MREIIKSFTVSIWFMFLTFPIMVIKVNTIEKTIEWRWERLIFVGIGSFFLSFLWRYLITRKESGIKKAEAGEEIKQPLSQRFFEDRRLFFPALGGVIILTVTFPLFFSSYQTNIMTNALMYVMLGLGLNIVVGLAGLLDLGYVAFYAVGAYCYALLNYHFGIGFWAVLPIAAAMGALFGILLGFPVLRLRGDYLAIVTLGFGEMIRLILENWNKFSFGPSGIANIPRPTFFGYQFSFDHSFIYIYYLMISLTILTIFVVNRLQNSRIGRAWIALREDEIACQAMGIDIRKTKLTAFALGATWAGMVGVVFAAKTTFVNPASFTFMESAIILSLIVLGGMGSIIGVILGAFIFILLPEYLRAIEEYRMLVFGAAMVVMMVFRPQGLISNIRRTYEFRSSKKQ
ncbi:MAG: branched-chain amino acid ABC transporter permease [Deltaproteobacteria bacterium]|nr:branched-chain amino acid ABC transporter permease [Deltaproteobacteria bacterium]MBW2050690.1 branched-chain amino acid ABC transporter permease [Deltaproteobacteria bacterium]MBW2140931.1 branched-chain amino acid ABC transporter permease [Deltaproteobacteria bacterium]MBW2323522.1 branched-chain amino acid ABC transporter permease [Deltaproteobacteria bacterium]